MPQIISVVNQKGGVGKTTTSINLSTYLALLGKFVLLIDFDPQANATSGLGIDRDQLAQGSYEALMEICPFSQVSYNTKIKGLKIVPATINLAGANVELVNLDEREFRLRQSLLGERNNYDYIIIDCPPSLGLLTVNSLTASTHALIPVQSEYYALEGLGQLLKTIDLIKEGLNPDLDILGAVLTMYDKRHRLSGAIMEELYRHFPNKIFRSVIPRNSKLAESPSHGQSIANYDPYSKGGRAYERLAREILQYSNNN